MIVYYFNAMLQHKQNEYNQLIGVSQHQLNSDEIAMIAKTFAKMHIDPVKFENHKFEPVQYEYIAPPQWIFSQFTSFQKYFHDKLIASVAEKDFTKQLNDALFKINNDANVHNSSNDSVVEKIKTYRAALWCLAFEEYINEYQQERELYTSEQMCRLCLYEESNITGTPEFSVGSWPVISRPLALS